MLVCFFEVMAIFNLLIFMQKARTGIKPMTAPLLFFLRKIKTTKIAKRYPLMLVILGHQVKVRYYYCKEKQKVIAKNTLTESKLQIHSSNYLEILSRILISCTSTSEEKLGYKPTTKLQFICKNIPSSLQRSLHYQPHQIYTHKCYIRSIQTTCSANCSQSNTIQKLHSFVMQLINNISYRPFDSESDYLKFCCQIFLLI